MTDVLPKIVAFKFSFTKDDGMSVILACLETGTVETRVKQLPLKKKPGVSHPPEFDGKG